MADHEKQPLLALRPNDDEAAERRDGKIIRTTRILIGFVLAFYALKISLWLALSEAFEPPTEKAWTFDEIEPSSKLSWKPCYGEMKQTLLCARLLVPMDYNRADDGPHVDLALMLNPSPVHGGDTWSPSPMLFNPGGPGGAGTQLLLAGAGSLRAVLGDDLDFVSFDPRGVGHTRPKADCFAYPKDGRKSTDQEVQEGSFHRYNWGMEATGLGLVNASDHALAEIDIRNRAVSTLCAERDQLQGNNSILRHISTPNVARDMVSIVDAWNEWRQELLEQKRKDAAKISEEAGPAHEEPAGKLIYWGFSYGTLLGATFAAMFPDKVHRVILDGVVDADHYVSPIWSESIGSADAIHEKMFEYCFNAGTDCPLYLPTDKFSSDISARVDTLYAALKQRPFYGIDPYTHTPKYVTYTGLRTAAFISLYFPRIASAQYTSVLASLLAHLSDSSVPLPLGFGPPLSLPSEYVCNAPSPELLAMYPMEAQTAIMCGDKRYALNDTLPALQSRFEKLAETSSFADVWITLMDHCSHWSIEQTDPPMRWDDHPAHKPTPIETAHPLLFLSNTLDPVTPLKAGVLMARKFVGAGLLEVEGEGHTTLAVPSRCAAKKIREYLKVNGTVPRAPGKLESGDWEKCEAEGKGLWEGAMGARESGETEEMQAWDELATQVMELDLWGLKGRGMKMMRSRTP